MIWLDPGLGVKKRRQLLAAALWPGEERTPGGEFQPQVEPPMSGTETLTRDEARALVRQGVTIQGVADRVGATWADTRAWMRGREPDIGA